MLYQTLKYQNYFVTALFKLVSFQIQLLCRIKGLPGSVQNKEVIGKCIRLKIRCKWEEIEYVLLCHLTNTGKYEGRLIQIN